MGVVTRTMFRPHAARPILAATIATEKSLMRRPSTLVITGAACIALLLAGAAAPGNQDKKEPTMTQIATGTFEVKLAPLDTYAKADKLGRMSIDKVFHGDLEAASQGEMLTAMTDVQGSAVYVAIERVTGTLNGKPGSFVLHHRGIMNNGQQELQVHVVPGSGTGELAGIAGQMTIRIEDGKHLYEFEYELR